MSRDGATHDVFISHSSDDGDVAEAARETIERAGHRCWIAPRDIVPGEKYGEAIINGIRASRIFLLIVSARSIASHQVERETERAANAGLAIIPFRIEDVKPSNSLEFFISSAHWLDAFEPPMERHYDYLTQVVGQLLAAKDSDAARSARAAAAGPVPAAPRPQAPAPRVPPRRPGLTIALAVVLALAVIGGGLAWWSGLLPGRAAPGPHGSYTLRALALDPTKPVRLRARPSLEARTVTLIPGDEPFWVAPAREGEWWRARRITGEEGYVLAQRVFVAGGGPQPQANTQAPADGAAPARENSQ